MAKVFCVHARKKVKVASERAHAVRNIYSCGCFEWATTEDLIEPLSVISISICKVIQRFWHLLAISASYSIEMYACIECKEREILFLFFFLFCNEKNVQDCPVCMIRPSMCILLSSLKSEYGIELCDAETAAQHTFQCNEHLIITIFIVNVNCEWVNFYHTHSISFQCSTLVVHIPFYMRKSRKQKKKNYKNTNSRMESQLRLIENSQMDASLEYTFLCNFR